MSPKRPTLKPSETLLPARMSLNLDALSDVRFATLDFPFQEALNTFVDAVRYIYSRKKGNTASDFDKYKLPPFRQLNMAIMACCPVLVHGFEVYNGTRRMVALNRLARDPETGAIIDAGSQYPDIESLADLVNVWIEHWLDNAELRTLVNESLQNELKLLKQNLWKSKAEWQPDVTLQTLINSLDQDGAMGFNLIPAVIMALLHGQTMTLTQNDGQPFDITWRKAHNGGARGLHLVSQPFFAHFTRRTYGKRDEADEPETFKEGYFVYRLSVRLQTQVGRQFENGASKPWIFLDVGMRRYADESFHSDSQVRDLTVLLGFNRTSLEPEDRAKMDRFPYDSTLIALPVSIPRQKNDEKTVWADNLSRLLSAYGLSALDDPQLILDAPAKFGNLKNSATFSGNEYYLIHTEGRKYHDDDKPRKGQRGHNFPITVGFSLKERTEVVQRVLETLPDVLIPDQPFEPDVKMPTRGHVPLMLRDYEYFALKSGDSPAKQTDNVQATLNAIRFAVQSAGKERLDIALPYHDKTFMLTVKNQLEAMLPGFTEGDDPFLCIHPRPVSPLAISPLDPGPLNPQHYFNKNRALDFFQKWADQMKAARPDKVKEWRDILAAIPWRRNAHRTALIESYYKDRELKPVNDSQSNKGAIREACSHEKVASQFILHFQVDEGKKLSEAHKGTIENALLDLLIRGTGAIYGPPAEMYDQVAELLPLRVPNLDVIAFHHVQTSTRLSSRQIISVIAVRLCVDGRTEVFAPGLETWIPYAQASATLGVAFARLRSLIRNDKKQAGTQNYLQMDNIQIMRFVLDVLKNRLDAPTIAVIEANWWRNARHSENDIARWVQLGNKRLFGARDVLDFAHVPGGEKYVRDDKRFANLLAVVRLRMDDETPQYTTGTQTWNADQQTGDLDHFSGYVDCTVTDPMHYFSVAGKSGLQRWQWAKDQMNAYKNELEEDFAYKHAQLVELLPFFVHEDFKNPEGFKILCRCIHFLRLSPAFSKGNTLSPYPMHLAKSLLDDLLCIVDAD